MSSVHALQKSTTRDKLLESMRALQPLLSAALLQECAADADSFLHVADEHDYHHPHDHHHRSNDRAGTSFRAAYHYHPHHEGYANSNGPNLYYNGHPEHNLQHQQDKSQVHHGFDYYYGLDHHHDVGHGMASLHQGKDHFHPIDEHDHHSSLQLTSLTSSSITMPTEELDFNGEKRPASLDSIEQSMLLLVSTPDSQSAYDDCNLPTEHEKAPHFEAGEEPLPLDLNTVAHEHHAHHLLRQSTNHEIMSSIDSVPRELTKPVWLGTKEWCTDEKEMPIPTSLPASGTKLSPTMPTEIKAPSVPNSHELKRCKSVSADAMRMEFSDDNDAMEDEADEDLLSLNGRVMGSKNLVSERKRRKKLNEKLYSLRAVVPRISKMDKASIVSDAIGYVQELQKQVEEIQNDILELHSSKAGAGPILEGPPSQCTSQISDAASTCNYNLPTNKIIGINVHKIEENTYHLGVQCKRGPGVLVQLTRAVEALGCGIIYANLATSGDKVINTIVVKITGADHEEVRERLLGIVPMYGLEF